jgi:hypothetical protein
MGVTACVFCGDSAGSQTREHVFAAWIGRSLNLTSTLEASRINPDGTTSSWRSRGFDQTVKATCAACNNGWMSDLEASVQSFLAPMVAGESRRLGRFQQQRCAAWALKTALMIAEMKPDIAIYPQREYLGLFRDGVPSTGTIVCLSTYEPHDDEGMIIAQSSSRSLLSQIHGADGWEEFMTLEEPRVGLAMFAIGKFVATVLSHNVPAELVLSFSPSLPGIRFEDHFQQVWPINRHHLHWPPRRTLSDLGGFRGTYQMWEKAR